MDPLPVFNPAQLLEISGGDRDYEREIVSEFLAQTEEGLTLIARALADGDATTISRTAHTLKGSSATLGADGVATLCGDLERIADRGDLAPAGAVLERARHALAETRTRLDDYFGEHRRAG